MDGQTYDDLALIMLYAQSWEERYAPEYRSAWKGSDFDSLDRLQEAGFTTGKHRNKSVTITPEGSRKRKS